MVQARKAVRGSTSGRPIMALFDVLGQRWTMRILWELRDGATNFRALRERCDDVSPTVLNRRLKELRNMDLVSLTDEGYAYTSWGKELSAQLAKLTVWSERWAAR
ncbi:winged helix-turn-helix transcriptional regulator [Terricaulis sp.]|uniref:winged helix-turn-helix transcriptional regulator n=1 Tax=Terricaulis sp. TaxID=2768686 RepID=UPI00378373EA